MNPLGRTQLGGVSMGVSQLTQCCCGTVNCTNGDNSANQLIKVGNFSKQNQKQGQESSASGTGKMTAIDDL